MLNSIISVTILNQLLPVLKIVLILNPDVFDLTLQMCFLTEKSNLKGEII